MKRTIATIVMIHFYLVIAACSNVTPITPSIKPAESSAPQADTQTSIPEQPAPTYTSLPPVETPTNLPKSLPEFQPITRENAEKIS